MLYCTNNVVCYRRLLLQKTYSDPAFYAWNAGQPEVQKCRD